MLDSLDEIRKLTRDVQLDKRPEPDKKIVDDETRKYVKLGWTRVNEAAKRGKQEAKVVISSGFFQPQKLRDTVAQQVKENFSRQGFSVYVFSSYWLSRPEVTIKWEPARSTEVPTKRLGRFGIV
jgi:hypothetical protein